MNALKKWIGVAIALFLPVLARAEAELTGLSAIQNELGWWCLLPAVIAILAALISREVIPSLVLGCLVGALLLSYAKDESLLNGLFLGFPNALRDALADADHMSVILFSAFIGATVHLISKNGGMMAMVKIFARRAKDRRSGQMVTYFLGLAIFFDDYANTMVVGNTMRPLTDRLGISREKLAYLVDSTAAPVASVALITTWIGAELGYIQDGLNEIEQGAELLGSPYGLFLDSLGYAFYPFLTLIFMFLLIWKRRDFGPMLRAERNARVLQSHDQPAKPADLDQVPEEKEFLSNALIPVGVIVMGTLAGLLYTGYQGAGWIKGQGVFNNISSILGASDPYSSLVWSATTGLLAALILSVLRRIFSLRSAMDHAMQGIQFMIPTLAILALAWTLSAITAQFGTAEFLAAKLKDGLSVHALPAIVFALSAMISFATGTSWGTMAILYPLVLASGWELGLSQGLDPSAAREIFVNILACVLAGSVLGDHCSPISDTTILSSMSSDCDHVAHVRTQMPYALVVGGVSLLLGIIPTSLGISPFVCFPVAAVALLMIVSYFGKKD